MKHFYLFLFSLVLLVGCSESSKPAGPKSNEIWYTTTDGNALEYISEDAFCVPITSHTYENGKGVITFESDIDRVASCVFSEEYFLETVTLPSSVVVIEAEAFMSCENLKSVELSEGTKAIHDSAFSNCISLESINLPKSLELIGAYAFSSCESLKSISIPGGVTGLDYSTFRYCTNLTKVTIPEGVTSIGGSCFYSCSNLKEITIPESVTSIGDYAFSGCVALTKVIVPEGVTSMGSCVFQECTGLEAVSLPKSLTYVNEYTFYGCVNLVTVRIPETVTWIGVSAFRSCESLTDIKFSEGLTSIGSYAFDDCTSLEVVDIPMSVESLGEGAFQDCSSLSEVTLPKGRATMGRGLFDNCSSDLVWYDETGAEYTNWDKVFIQSENRPVFECIINSNYFIVFYPYNSSDIHVGKAKLYEKRGDYIYTLDTYDYEISVYNNLRFYNVYSYNIWTRRNERQNDMLFSMSNPFTDYFKVRGANFQYKKNYNLPYSLR